MCFSSTSSSDQNACQDNMVFLVALSLSSAWDFISLSEITEVAIQENIVVLKHRVPYRIRWKATKKGLKVEKGQRCSTHTTIWKSLLKSRLALEWPKHSETAFVTQGTSFPQFWFCFCYRASQFSVNHCSLVPNKHPSFSKMHQAVVTLPAPSLTVLEAGSKHVQLVFEQLELSVNTKPRVSHDGRRNNRYNKEKGRDKEWENEKPGACNYQNLMIRERIGVKM